MNETNDDGQTAFSCLGSRQRDYGYESIIPRHHKDLKEVLPKINIKECVKILLCAGARINHKDHKYKNNGLKNYIIQNVKVDRDICMFLYAAEETIDGTTIRATEIYYDHRDFWRATETQCDVPEYLFFKDLRLDLKHLCRQTIRKHLLNLDPHEHLFGRIPKLGLPRTLSKYLLFNFSLEEDYASDTTDNDKKRSAEKTTCEIQ